jgi:hypothetical protein
LRGRVEELTMLELSRLAVVAVVGAALAAPAMAQTPEGAAPPEPLPRATPGTPEAAPAPCGQRLELFIGSVLSQLGGTQPSTEAQRRALEGFKSAAEKAREMVHSACANERSAATVREVEAAEKQLEVALESLRPALEKLYASLSDADKAQIDAFRRQLEVWLKDIWRDFALDFNFRPDSDGRSARDQFRMCFEGFCFSMPRRFPNESRGYRWRDEGDSGRL